MSELVDHPYLDWPVPIAFAHRGGALEGPPENTLAAFAHAVELGYRYLETDVHLTADGVLVAFHDDDLQRSCGVDARIGDLPWSELAELRVDGQEPIPAMRELFEEFPAARFNIDAKASAAVDPLCDLVEELAAIDRVCLASFRYRHVRRIRRRLGPRVLTNTSQPETAALVALGWMPSRRPVAAQIPPDFGRIRIVTERLIRNAHRRGTPVHVWTIDEPDEMNELLDLGVDGIMTDRPGALREVLEARGQWHE